MRSLTILALCAIFVTPVLMFPFTASGEAVMERGPVFSDVAGKEWMLSGLKIDGKTITIDRKKFEADNMGGFYSLSFREEESVNQGMIGGMGAPNRYFGPFTASDNKILTIGNIAGTMMLAFREPEELKEREYFEYLSKVTRWDLRNGKLELYSINSSGSEAILLFTQ